MHTGTGRLFIGVCCLLILVQGVAASQMSPEAPAGGSPVLSSAPGEGGSLSSVSPAILRDSPAPSRAEIRDEFLDLALDLENPGARHTVTRWARPMVAVKISGDPGEESRDCLAESLAEIDQLTGQVGLQLSRKENPEIEIHFIPLGDFPARVPGYSEGSAGYTRCESRKGFLQKCSIWVPSTDVGEGLGCTILRHELLHGLGLPGHSNHSESILFQGTVAGDFSSLDRDVIRLLYNPALPPGFGEELVREYLA